MRMNVEGNRKVQPGEQRQRVRREIDPEVIACIEAHVKLCNAALRMELLEETSCASQVSEGLENHPFHRNAFGGKLRLIHQPSHPVAVVMCTAELRAGGVAPCLACSPGVLRLDAERGGDHSRIDSRVANAQRDRKLILAHGNTQMNNWQYIEVPFEAEPTRLLQRGPHLPRLGLPAGQSPLCGEDVRSGPGVLAENARRQSREQMITAGS